MRKTDVRPWTPQWRERAETEMAWLEALLGGELLELHHIGSTSVEAIGWAKPVVDLLAVVRRVQTLDGLDEAFAQLGYEAKGENGIAGRRFYVQGGDRRTVHLHAFEAGAPQIGAHLQFRDYLEAHPERARAYGEHKRELAVRFADDDTHLYQEAKQPFVQRLVQEAEAWSAEMEAGGGLASGIPGDRDHAVGQSQTSGTEDDSDRTARRAQASSTVDGPSPASEKAAARLSADGSFVRPPRRSEEEMMALILGTARADERVRAVCLNGSRVNPLAPMDKFQDYDVIYLVTELDSYLADDSWIDVFGERVILQMPERMGLIPPEGRGSFAYLMQLADGNRIDLRLIPLEQAEAYLAEDRLTRVLLDKDSALPELPEPSDADFHVQPPRGSEFADCANEFWWVSTYVAKGLWRSEPLYALDHLNGPVRAMLLQMLDWQAGARHGFAVSTGKSGKYLDRWLPAESWQALLATYPSADSESVWTALLRMAELFGSAARDVAARLDLAYDEEEERRVLRYLLEVKEDAGQR
ncbi:hypothetical protein HGI30_03865 [Paenibacillus albicereus]|uniref:Aminoglycoside 6-adenylyltransferase n=1 Tax=Paenibacillus albicereus TaxID=2726185 RepID=A0A6H2GUD9_9BACL|nr:aminoglycoside 6-adenylyltransferase [Paenibacillus albicereus]QJC50786.1 hypothetical protein HGI30_03865 [Paenibacillus albicereus]